jgi:hypothetical protein
VYVLITRARAAGRPDVTEAIDALREALTVADADEELRELVYDWASQLGVPRDMLG